MTAHDDRARDERDPRRAMTAPEIFAKLREQPAPAAREIPADELQPEERACAISPVFRETALRMAEVIDKPYPEVPMALLDEVFCELIERGVIR